MDGLVLVSAMVLNPRAKRRERRRGQDRPHDGDGSSPATSVQSKSLSSPVSKHRLDTVEFVA
jgi:hypothetical protein